MGPAQIEITTILNGRVTQRAALVKDRILVGRSAGCDVRIDHAGVSRSHALIMLKAGGVFVEDLESSNGTRVNGKPMRSARLRNGDILQIGSFLLHVEFDEDADGSNAACAVPRHEEQTVAMPPGPPTPPSEANAGLAANPSAST